MKRRQLAAAIIGIVAAVVCVRLGIWQLHRLAQRRAYNARVDARMAGRPAPLASLPVDTAELQYRRVRVRGRWDYDHEFALTSRSHDGSPGVNIFTPLIPDGIDNAVLVNRGWVYSPDGATVDFARWHEGERDSLVAYVDLFPRPEERDARSTRNPRAWHRLDTLQLGGVLPYRVEPYYLVALRDSGALQPDSTPVRLGSPDLGEGPHFSYALQWFSFATIALVGAGILIWRDRPSATEG